MEKYLHAIGDITNPEESRESNDSSKKYTPSSNKAKRKDSANIERLNKYLKALTNEVS